MTALLDVNVLLAIAWDTHPLHGELNQWFDSQRGFATCSISQMGFLRVSMSPGFGASFEDALQGLSAVLKSKKHRFLPDETKASDLPFVTSSKLVTDAHLGKIAAKHRCKLATLDEQICTQPWARQTAFHPLKP